VLPEFSDFTAIITGRYAAEHEGYKRALDDKIRAAGLTERIVFVGEVPIDEVPLWYQNVSIMVACPRYEPFGITPLEAMASGCAVVASRTGAFEYIVQAGETGELVPTGDAAALAEAIRTLIKRGHDAIDSMGRAGRARVTAEFSIQKEASGIRDVYQTVTRAD
jgi:mannosyltransferase